ncbi:unnamed protein product [marine sediment metagenome]|uniref:Uncharacterized protein n=1 Tax=marine sediment metagenome TaxID=412755 RepID=X1E092_9ZZZZ
MVNETVEETKCIHHWIIDSDNTGICKYCKEVKNFSGLQRRESKFLGLKSVFDKAEVKATR